MYGSGRRVENWNDPRYGIRESSKLLNGLLNKRLTRYKGRERSERKIETLDYMIQAEKISEKQGDYMIRKIYTGMNNIPKAINAVCDPRLGLYQPPGVVPELRSPIPMRSYQPQFEQVPLDYPVTFTPMTFRPIGPLTPALPGRRQRTTSTRPILTQSQKVRRRQ